MDNWSNGGQPLAPGTSAGEKRMQMEAHGGGEDKPSCPYRLKHPDQPCLNYEVCSNYYDHGHNYCKAGSVIITLSVTLSFHICR